MSAREWLPAVDGGSVTGDGAVHAFVGSYASDAGLRWGMEARCCSFRRIYEFGFKEQADAQHAAERWLDETEREVERKARKDVTA